MMMDQTYSDIIDIEAQCALTTGSKTKTQSKMYGKYFIIDHTDRKHLSTKATLSLYQSFLTVFPLSLFKIDSENVYTYLKTSKKSKQLKPVIFLLK